MSAIRLVQFRRPLPVYAPVGQWLSRQTLNLENSDRNRAGAKCDCNPTAEVVSLNLIKCAFKSHQSHQFARVAQSAEASRLEREGWSFEYSHGHHDNGWVIGQVAGIAWKAVGTRESVGFNYSTHPPVWRVNRSGGRRRFEIGWCRESGMGIVRFPLSATSFAP